MMAKFNSKASVSKKFFRFFEPFRPRFVSKLTKSAYIIQTFSLAKYILGIH
jgi:hypothetical protein